MLERLAQIDCRNGFRGRRCRRFNSFRRGCRRRGKRLIALDWRIADLFQPEPAQGRDLVLVLDLETAERERVVHPGQVQMDVKPDA